MNPPKLKYTRGKNPNSRGNYRTHGMSETSEYRIWGLMKNRCFNIKSQDYPRYGARGIKVCKRWLIFENFIADMGKKPEGLCLDRINNNKGYSPKNCRWATFTEQNNNRRDNRIFEYKGSKFTMAQLAREMNIPYKNIQYKLRTGKLIVYKGHYTYPMIAEVIIPK